MLNILKPKTRINYKIEINIFICHLNNKYYYFFINVPKKIMYVFKEKG